MSINHVTEGKEGSIEKSVTKTSRGGGEVKDFLKPQSAILRFSNSVLYDLSMNLVALIRDFQNQICFIAQGTYPWIMKFFGH